MSSSSGGTPLAGRRRDLFFVVTLFLFTATSLFSDALHALGWQPEGFDPNAVYAAWIGDHLFAENPLPLRVRLYISGFLYGPLTAWLGLGFVRGWNHIRPAALLYAGAMIATVGEYFVWQFAGDAPPDRVGLFLAFNGPYLVVPLLLAARMWRERPFG